MTAALEGGEWLAARPGRTLPPGKDPVPILQETGLAPEPVWIGGQSRHHRDSIPDRPARRQSLYRLNYPAHQDMGYTRQCIPICLIYGILTLRNKVIATFGSLYELPRHLHSHYRRNNFEKTCRYTLPGI